MYLPNSNIVTSLREKFGRGAESGGESGERRVVSGFAGEKRNKNFRRKFLNYYNVRARLEDSDSGIQRDQR